MPLLNDYKDIVGQDVIEELRVLADRLKGLTVKNINSTAVGGGVAEILHRMVPLLRELNLDARWDVIKGGERFFQITKNIHNALHGSDVSLSQDDFDFFIETNRANLENIACDCEIMFIHDPQPIGLIESRRHDTQKWLWRCHIDLSAPKKDIWNFLKPYVERYDAAVFSAPIFSPELSIRQFLISPSIDPLSDKNREMTNEEIEKTLAPFKIDFDKPMILQVSRFDYLKDPVGVIEAYKIVKDSIDCQLVLAGGTATDDPESDIVLAKVREAAAEDPDIHVLLIPSGSDLIINALQRKADVIMQKSLREGFGLTVTEALWKGKPLVASAAGGIPLQVKHRYHGLLCHSIEGAAYAIKQLLNTPGFGARLGENGREHVRHNYLLTRHLKEYLLLFIAIGQNQDIISL
jgi:trehalose synthase